MWSKSTYAWWKSQHTCPCQTMYESKVFQNHSPTLSKCSISFNLHSICYDIKMIRDPKRLFLFLLDYLTLHLYLSFPSFIYLFVYLFIANLLILSFSIWKMWFQHIQRIFVESWPNLLDVEKQLSNFYNRFQQVAKI
jgi:hypothetical protein